MDGHNSTNGRPKAILYARVSSTKQAEKGFSLSDQFRALREYASKHGYNVVAEEADPGVSGASLERPGLNRVRDLVAAGGVDVVLVRYRDRIARDPVITGWLQLQFKDYGTKLRAISDPEEDSPAGELTAGILDQIAELQRAMIAEQTRSGRMERARKGKVIGSGSPPYGFRYNADRTNYLVDERTMPTVRRMFQMVADDYTLHGVIKVFEDERIPTPGGGERWYTVSMRRMILNHAYRPHTYDELNALVSPDVLAGLDETKRYGVWWYGQNRVELTPAGTKKRRFTMNPKEQHIAIPVPDAGIPRETVEAARAAINSSYRPRRPSKHFYELRGMLFCGCCDLRMTGYSTGEGYRYYACQKRKKWGKGACPGPLCRADDLEEAVQVYVDDLFSDPERITADIDEAIAKETAALRNPDKEAAGWLQAIVECDRKRAAYQDQQAAGLMTLDELGAKLRKLKETRATAEMELSRVRDGQRNIRRLEANKRFILETYGEGLQLVLYWFPPQMRRTIYEMLGLKITVPADGIIRVQANVDVNVTRLSRDIEEYGRRLNEAKWNVEENPVADAKGQIELIERERRTIRKELSSKRTDKVMAEVAT